MEPDRLTANSFKGLAPELIHAILDDLTFDKVVAMITGNPSYFNTCVLSHQYHGKVFGAIQDNRGGDLGRLADAILLFYELSGRLRTYEVPSRPQIADLIPNYPIKLLDRDMRNLNRKSSTNLTKPNTRNTSETLPKWLRQYSGIVLAVVHYLASLQRINYELFFLQNKDSDIGQFKHFAGRCATEAKFAAFAGPFVRRKAKEAVERVRSASKRHKDKSYDQYQAETVKDAMDHSFVENLRREFEDLACWEFDEFQKELIMKILPESAYAYPRPNYVKVYPKDYFEMSPMRLVGKLWAYVTLVDAAESVFILEMERRVHRTMENLPRDFFPSLQYYLESASLRSPYSSVTFAGYGDLVARERRKFWLQRLHIKLSKIKSHQLLFLADLLDKYPTRLAQSSHPTRAAACRNPEHVSRRLRTDARRLTRTNFCILDGPYVLHTCDYIFQAIELPLVPLDDDINRVCAFVSRNPLPEADIAASSAEASSALAEFAPPVRPLPAVDVAKAGSEERYEYPEAVKSDIHTVFDGMRYIVREYTINEKTLELEQHNPLPRVQVEMVGSAANDGERAPSSRRVVIKNYRELRRVVSPADRWRCHLQPPFEQGELDWLAAFLNVRENIPSVG